MTTEKRFRAWWLWFALAIGFIAACAWLGLAAEHLFLGWIYFALRVLPRVTIDASAVVVGGISLAGFVAGMHFTASWWVRATAPPDGAPQPWSWRSSFALSTLILLLFAAGTAMVGATHQLVWLIQGRPNRMPVSSQPVLGILESARESARRESFNTELKYLGMGVANYEDVYGKTLPPGGTITADGKLMHGWAAYLIPGLNYSLDIDFAVPWNRTPNARYFQCNLPTFVNP